MRDITFRAIPKDKEKYGSGFISGNLTRNNPGIGEMTYYIRKFCDWNLYMEIEVDPETIGQFIELKDKNGARIYEGDVVRINDNPELVQGTEFEDKESISDHRIYWDRGRALFWDLRLNDGDSLAGYLDGDISFVNEGTIIGNIHQEPKYKELYI